MTNKSIISAFCRCFFGKETMASNASNVKKNNRNGHIKLLLIGLFVGVFLANSWAQSPITLTGIAPTTAYSDNSTTWVCPAGVTSITVECWGGGGAGGGSNTGYYQGSGGAGGSYVKSTVTVTPGTTYYLTAGSGGYSSASTSTTLISPPIAGNSSFFSTTVSSSGALVLATGGAAGTIGTSSNETASPSSTNRAAPAGATPITASLGSVTGNVISGTGVTNIANTKGGDGGLPVGGASGTAKSGAGGDGGNSSGTGAAATTSAGTSQFGTAGTIPGGGGSGSSSLTANRNGGQGGSGKVVLTYTVPTPSSQPTSLSFSNVGATSVDVNFTPVSGTSTLVVQYPTGTAVGSTTNPTNGTTYTAGNTLGTGKVVYAGTASTATINSLTQNTNYVFYFYSYYGASSTNAYPVYYTTSPLSGNQTTTNPVLPTAQPNNLTATPSSTGTSYTFTWGNPSGTGPNTLVVVYPHYVSGNSGSTNSPTAPSATTYTANAAYGSGSALGSGYVVYNGLSSVGSVTVTGLSAQTAYDVYLYSFNTTLYLTSTSSPTAVAPLTNSSILYTLSAPPSSVGGTLSLASVNSTTASITLGSPAGYPSSGASKAGYLIVYSTGTPALVTSPSGLAPASAVGTGSYTTVTETSAPTAPTITGTQLTLTTNTQYTVLVVPYTWDGSDVGTYNYLTTGALTQTVTVFTYLVNTDFTGTSPNWASGIASSVVTVTPANGKGAYTPTTPTPNQPYYIQNTGYAFGNLTSGSEKGTVGVASGNQTVAYATASAQEWFMDFKVAPNTNQTLNVTGFKGSVALSASATADWYAVQYGIGTASTPPSTSSFTAVNGASGAQMSTGSAATYNFSNLNLSTSISGSQVLYVRVILYRANTGNSGSTVVFSINSLSVLGTSTLAVAPSSQPTSFSATGVSGGIATLNWTNGSGTGTNTLIEVYPHFVSGNSGATNSATNPSIAYTASTTYTSGDALGSGYVVFNGSGNSVAISGLQSSTQYDVALYSFNGQTAYNTSSPLTGSFTTLATPTITSSLTATAYSSVSFSYQITATANPALLTSNGYYSNTPFSTAYSGALSGLSLNANTGVLSGTVATTGTYSIDIEAANANGFTPATLVLTVAALPTPTITSLSQTGSLTGSTGFTLTVNGTNFFPGGVSTVTWAGSSRTTTYVSSTQLTASITTSDLSTTGTFAVGVTNNNGTTTNNSASTITYTVGNTFTTPYTTAGAGTWTCPAGVTSIKVEAWGGGGAGGGCALLTSPVTYEYEVGGGGAGGSYISHFMTVVPGTTYNFNVGAGGTGVAGTANTAGNGNAGGSSYFGNPTPGSSANATVLASGGLGGNGAMGLGTTTSKDATGATVVNGSTTGNLPSSGYFYIDKGGDGLAATPGTSPSSGAGGAGANSGGAGGAAVAGFPSASTNGNNGTAPGGGGSGANTKTLAGTGGNGGDGKLIISYTNLPIITSALTASGIEFNSFSYTITARNASSYTFSNLPSWLTASGATISGTIPSGGAGTYNVTINATNTNGTDSKTLVITVTDQTPVITSSTTTINGLVGTAITNYNITATNMASTPNGYSATNLPTGLTCDADGTIHGTPSASGTFNATLKATNAVTNGTKTLTFVISSSVVTTFTTAGTGTWTCPAGVHAITIETWGGGGAGAGMSSSSQIYNEGSGGAGGSYVKASLAVTPGTTYNLTVGAGGAASTNNTGNTGGSSFFGNTSPSTTVSTGASVLATGGTGGISGTSTNTTTYTSSNKQGPFAGGAGSTTGNIVTLSGTTIAGGDGGATVAGGENTTTGSGSHSGAGGVAPTGSISGGTGGAVVSSAWGTLGTKAGLPGTQPGGGGSGASNRTATGTGGAGGAGEIIISYTALPTITSAFTASGIEQVAFSYTIVADNATSYSFSNLPSWLTASGATISTSGTIPSGSAGTYNVTIKASNTYGDDIETLVITVTNQTPVITSSLTTITGLVGTAITNYTITATNSPTSYSVKYNSTDLNSVGIGLSYSTTTGIISGTPSTTGSYNLTITASNSVATSAPVTLTYTISSSVTVPYTTAGNGTWTCPAGVTAITVEAWGGGGAGGGCALLSSPATYQYEVGGGGAGGSYISYNMTVVPGTTYNFTVGAGGTGVAGTSTTAGNGNAGGSSYFGNTTAGSSTGASVLAKGGAGGNGAKGLGTSTNKDATGATIAPGSTTGNLPASGYISNQAGADGAAAIPGTSPSSGAGGAGANSGGAGGAAVSGFPSGSTNGSNGTAPGGGGSGANTKTLAGTGGNGGDGKLIITYAATPLITSSTTAIGTVGSAFSYSIIASGSPSSYTVTGTLPSGVTLNSTTGVISSTSSAGGVVPAGTGGTYPVTVYAHNTYGDGATIPLTITITEKPTITSALALTLSVGTTMPTYTITATQSPTSYTCSALPAGLNFTAATGTITGTPTSTVGSPFSVSISATNATGTDTKTLVITVDARPGITSSLTASGTVGTAISTYTIQATQGPTSYDATGLPAGLSINRNTGVISGTPTVTGLTSATPYNVTISATNATGTGTATLVFTINPATTYYYSGSGALDVPANWYTAPGGASATSVVASTFSPTVGATFNILSNATTASNSAIWTIGSGSNITVGSGVTLTVAADATGPTVSKAITGTVNVSGTGTLSIANATVPTLGTLSATSTVIYAGNITQSVSITPTYGNLTISGTTTGTLAAGTIIINGTLTVNSGATLSGATGISSAAIIQINGNAHIYGTVNLLTASKGYFTGTGNFYLENGATLMNGYNGGISVSPSTTLAIRNTGTRYFDPGASYVIQPDATNSLGAGFPATCKDLTIAVTITGKTISLIQPLNVTGTLSITSANTTLATGGYLTLKSTSTNSGIVGNICSTCAITGLATVERYIPMGYRAYRDMAPEVYNAGSIFSQWQEGGVVGAVGGTTGKTGIFITGTSAADPNTGTNTNPIYANFNGNANSANPSPNASGLDYSPNGMYSAFLYNNTTQNGYIGFGSANASAITNTTTTLLDAFRGYRVLVRGARDFNLYQTPLILYAGGLRMNSATTLRATGNLVYGTVTYNTSGVTATVNGAASTTLSTAAKLSGAQTTFGSNGAVATGFNMVANPYVCPVSWNSVFSASSGINGTYWYLDPTQGAAGKYLAYNYSTGTNTRTVTGANTVGYGSTGLGYSTGYIQPGQAFFVLNSTVATPNPTVIFNEAAKVGTSYMTNVFGAKTPLSKIYMSLEKQVQLSGVTTYEQTEGAAVAFKSDFTNVALGPQDAIKFGSSSDNLYISDKGMNLSIDGRLPATATDAIALKISKPSTTVYQLKVDATDYINEGYTPLLFDALKNTTTAIATVDSFKFTVDTANKATYESRFTILFTPSTLPVNSIVASASLNNKVATITWNTVGEKNVVRYEVEKSADAKTFTKISQATAKNTATANYSTTENNVTATTYYRIKAVSSTGSISYSNVAKVQLAVNSNQFAVYPNPLVGKTLNFGLTNVNTGKYVVSIYNVLGEKVSEQSINHAGGSASHAITISNTLARGVYNVVVSEATSDKQVYQTNLSVQP